MRNYTLPEPREHGFRLRGVVFFTIPANLQKDTNNAPKYVPKMVENGAKKNQGGPSRADMAWKAMDRVASGRNGPERAGTGDKNTCKSYVTGQRYD